MSKPGKEFSKVFLTIDIEDKYMSQVHSIGNLSEYVGEEEVLFNYNTFILVLKIENKEDQVDLHCTLSDFDECKDAFPTETLDYKEKFQEILKIKVTQDKYILGRILCQMGKYDEYLSLLLNISENSGYKLNEMGLVYFKKGEYENALKYY